MKKNKFNPKHTALCLFIYSGAIVLACAFWYGIYTFFCAIGLLPWQAIIMVILSFALMVEIIMCLAGNAPVIY